LGGNIGRSKASPSLMRQTLQTLFGFDLSTGQKWIIAFAVILALLALLGLFARQIKGGRLRVRGQGGGRARQPRLGVVDIHDLDRQRQLILIRRDNVEHLIMIGGVSDIVVETNILRSGGRAATALPTETPATERPGAFETLPPAEAARQDTRQEPRQELRQEQPTLERLPIRSIPGGAPARPAQQGPTQAEPPAAVAAAVVLPSLAAAATQIPTPAVQPPSFTRDFSPSQSASAVELDSMTQQLEEALKRPHSAVRSANAPAEPRQPQDEPKPSAPPIESVAETPTLAPAMPTPTPPAPPETAGRPIPLPADVEAELEMALGLRPERMVPKAPAVTVTTKPAPVAPPPAPPAPGPVVEPEPVKVAPAKSEPAAAAEQAPADDIEDSFLEAPGKEARGKEAPSKLAESAPEHKHEASTAPEPGKSASEPEPALKPEPRPEPAPEPKPAAIDPFSVDAIEAEFARLLGRDPKPKS
jgi:flagellar protein FliO/FliZ